MPPISANRLSVTADSAAATVYCQDERFRLYIDETTIGKRVNEIAEEINQTYENKVPILIAVLNGAFMFVADLMRAIQIDCEIDFLKLSSYGAEKVSSGDVHELKRIDADIRGRHVIVIEDIVDTGHSMRFILDSLSEFEPASIAVATFLYKPEAIKFDLKLDYVGFEIPNRFVLGYGLDYGQLGRNLRAVYIEDPE
jgi:hypoxanthine phosphoribosyltransferase